MAAEQVWQFVALPLEAQWQIIKVIRSRRKT